MLVSIITPSYNSADFIKETIQSVLAQDYSPIEFIIIDGGSTDGTLEILKRYQDHIQWISEPDHGMTEALNKGFRMARGDILSWINADDIYHPGILTRSVAYLITHPEAAAVFSDGEMIDSESRHLKNWKGMEFSLTELLLGNHYICQPTLFIRRSIFDHAGCLDEQFAHYTMDLDLLLRLGSRYEIGYLNILGAGFRIHDKSKTSTQQIGFHHERIATLDKFFNTMDQPSEVQQIKDEVYARAYLAGGCQYYFNTHIQQGQDALSAAYHRYPEIFNNPDVFLPLIVGSLPYGLDPLPMVTRLYDHLPPDLKHLGYYRNKAINLATVASAFQAHQYNDQQLVRKRLAQVLINDPTWLKNKGVFSIGVQSILGPGNFHHLKNVFLRW